MKLPSEVRELLRRRFDSRHRDWLSAPGATAEWPWDIPLGLPTEQSASARLDAVAAWAAAWRSWQGEGDLTWTERRWRTLGTQRLPQMLRLDGPRQVAAWLGELERWDRASQRLAVLGGRWPMLVQRLGRLFGVLADYSQDDFDRLVATLAWLERHPDSGLYLRQLPIPGLDTKWIESRKAVLAELFCCITGRPGETMDFHALCGLRRAPMLVRMRILDPALRARTGGIGDLAATVDDLAQLDIHPTTVLIIENLQTGLALGDIPGAVAFMALGYGATVLAQLPWVHNTDCLYWGDIDTHGFAILHQVRSCLPALRSLLMEERTLLSHRAFWTHEASQHAGLELPYLYPHELAIYQALKLNTFGQAVRLEQERIEWDHAWTELVDALK
nr:DUF3322 domain-containing protein [uncultured Massilia sp.]